MQLLENYVQIMINSLEKKVEVLNRLIIKTQIQTEILKNDKFDNIDWDRFNMVMVEKEEEIDHISEMDQGFQSLYNRVGEQLKANSSQYEKEIRHMQELIKTLEEKSLQIQTAEARNRSLIEGVIGTRKKEIRQTRNSMKAAASYHQAMIKSMDVDVSSMDKKK